VNNVVYANSNRGIRVNGVYGTKIVNNTVYQEVGGAVRLDSSSINTLLRNNILWVAAGYDVYVASSSQSGFSSDYNLLYQGVDPNAHVGYWGSATRDTLPTGRPPTGRTPTRPTATRGW